jgi:hypothetical protein
MSRLKTAQYNAGLRLEMYLQALVNVPTSPSRIRKAGEPVRAGVPSFERKKEIEWRAVQHA